MTGTFDYVAERCPDPGAHRYCPNEVCFCTWACTRPRATLLSLIAHKANLTRPHRTDTEWKRANLPAPDMPAELL